jgi:hypothetical protein
MNDVNKIDPFGAAVSDYFFSRFRHRKKIIVNSSISGIEKIAVSYLFRSYKKMPELEKKALGLCYGKILDVGACSGSHALELQKKNCDVTALEISPLCCEIMSKRGVNKLVCSDIFEYKNAGYDTVLLLMNGIGIAGTIEGLRTLLTHLRNLLSSEGQIIFDSSDIEYAYFEEDGSKWIDLNNDYYGQVNYTMQYKNVKGPKFNWLFIDRIKMSEIASETGFNFSVLAEGDHYDYLGVLKPII